MTYSIRVRGCKHVHQRVDKLHLPAHFVLNLIRSLACVQGSECVQIKHTNRYELSVCTGHYRCGEGMPLVPLLRHVIEAPNESSPFSMRITRRETDESNDTVFWAHASPSPGTRCVQQHLLAHHPDSLSLYRRSGCNTVLCLSRQAIHSGGDSPITTTTSSGKQCYAMPSGGAM